jgi:hypothetical protein
MQRERERIQGGRREKLLTAMDAKNGAKGAKEEVSGF